MITSMVAKISEPAICPAARPVFLIGFMGSGKTTVGKLLAEKLKIGFVDVDRELELLFGMPIHRIFSQGLEAKFREAESSMVAKLAKPGELSVISTGGGACSDPAASHAMHDGGIVFWLDAPWPVLRARIPGDPRRPMLARDPEALFNDRKRLYEACAHYRVDASGSSGKIADAISGFI